MNLLRKLGLNTGFEHFQQQTLVSHTVCLSTTWVILLIFIAAKSVYNFEVFFRAFYTNMKCIEKKSLATCIKEN